jgi:Xaa-Pro aminopeptidase
MFGNKTYIERRNLLKKKVGSGLVLFLGNEESPMNYPANTYPFRQDSSFLYYFGLDGPGLAATIDVDGGHSTIFGNDIGLEDVIWMGPQPRIKDRASRVGITRIAAADRLESVVKDALKQKRRVHYLAPYRAETVARLRALTGIPLDAVRARVSPDLTGAVIQQRAIKSAEEVDEIEGALEITAAMVQTAMRLAKPGRAETFVLGGMEGVMRSLGGAWAFPPIVTVNGHVFHNHAAGNVLSRGRMLLVDSGSESPLHYASDITRSIPVGGRFSRRQKDIYDIVLEAQRASIDAIKPGTRYRDIHLNAANIITTGLKGLGLMKGDPAAAVENGAHALFFPHGLGHMLGLDVHDMEALGETHVGYDESVRRSGQFGLAYLRMARELRPGHVLTVEPGIYFIPALIDIWKSQGKFAEFIDYRRVERWRDFGGIRIEDNVLVTARGRRVLGPPIPKDPGDVEKAAG